MTCLCIDDLRPASFRGVAFFVASDKGEYGRRDIVHEYPMRDDPYIEDMGQKATKFSVSGYLFGDDWIAKKDAIVAACTARGPAILQLPTEAPVMVACPSLTVSRTKDECGFYALTFEFVAAKNFNVPAAVGAVESQIGSAFNAAIAPMTAMYDQQYVGENVAQYVTDRQIDRLTDFASVAISTVESSPSLSDDMSSKVVRAGLSIFQNAAIYTSPDPTEALTLVTQPEVGAAIGKLATVSGYTVVAGSGVTINNGASAIVPVIAYVINNLGNSLAPDDAITALTVLAEYSSNETSLEALEASRGSALGSNPISPSDRADAENGALFCGVVRSFALMKLAQAISVKNFTDRASAIQARATVVELFNSQAEQFSEDAIVNVIMQCRDLAVQAISKKMASIVPVLTINAPLSRPSLYWAGRLYDDANRAEELSDRNNANLSAFMPTHFEALSR